MDEPNDMETYEDCPILSHMPKFSTRTIVDDNRARAFKMCGMTYECANSMREIKKQFRDQVEQCDVTLIVQNTELKAHWCVLLACPYFEALYRSSLTYGIRPEKLVLNLAPFNIIRSVIFFLYGTRTTVSLHTDRLVTIIAVADFLLLDSLKTQCFASLLKRDRDVASWGSPSHIPTMLNVSRCVLLCWLSRTYGHQEMYEKAFNYLCVHFSAVVRQGDILELPEEFMHAIITNKTLNCVSCADVLNLITKWTEHKEENRLPSFQRLLISMKPLIRMSYEKDLKEAIINHKFVRSSEEMSGFLDEITEYYFNNYPLDCLLVADGSENKNNYCVYILDQNRWVDLPFITNTGCVSLNNSILCHSVRLDDRGAYTRGELKKLTFYDLSRESQTATDHLYIKDYGMCYLFYCYRILTVVGHEIVALLLFSDRSVENSPHFKTQACLSLLDKTTGCFNAIHETFVTVTRLIYAKFLTVVVSDRYLCVLTGETNNEHLYDIASSKNLFFNYDIQTRTVKCKTAPDVNMLEVLYMYAYQNMAVVGEYDLDYAYICDFSARQQIWKRSYDLAVTVCPFNITKYGHVDDPVDPRTKPYYQLVTYNDCLYSFMESDNIFTKTTASIVKYNIPTKQWTEIKSDYGPSRLIGSLHFARVSAKRLRCSSIVHTVKLYMIIMRKQNNYKPY